MSSQRHDHLIKCAEHTIGLMNIGIDPNAALLKVAKENELNGNEVMLVSHAINNSRTVSQLVNAKNDDEKGEPFTLTNAELVNQQLYQGTPVSDAAKKDQEAAAKKNESTDAMAKKEAAARSCVDDGWYLDVTDDSDHAAVAREAFGAPAATLPQAKLASLSVDEDLQVHFDAGDQGLAKLGALRHQIDEAGIEATRAHDDAQRLLAKLADTFRRTDGPRFARVEKLARRRGADQTVVDLVYENAGLKAFHEPRVDVAKLASDDIWSQIEDHSAEHILQLENLIKRAGACQALRQHLREGMEAAERAWLKMAEDDEGKSVGHAVEHVSSELGELPDKLTGAAFAGPSKAVDLLNSASGTAGEAPTFDASNPPLPLGSRQELENLKGHQSIEKLLADDYVGQHPVQDVVAAFNRAQSANPHLGEAALTQLVRQDLAGGGAPLDTLLRVGKGHDQGARP